MAGVGVKDGSVLPGGGIYMGHHVDMDRASGVMARVNGVEGDSAVLVGLLETTEECGVDVFGGFTVITPRGDTRVHTSGVAVCWEVRFRKFR